MSAQRVVVLISGRGSNLGALIAAGLPVSAVLSNRADAPGLALAQAHGIVTEALSPRDYMDRIAFDRALSERIDHYRPDLVVLAGYMRILSDEFVMHYQGRLINIHPSLLPSYPGMDTHARALSDGVKIHGCTVHFVMPELDSGPIIIQAGVPVHADDSVNSLTERVLAAEHRIYQQAIAWYLQGRLTVDAQGRVNVADASPMAQSVLMLDVATEGG
uniref:phosphoribosylglycinamide formyltransferase 1 n=1 Tax=mine drainage metagenome TaxID=410659 RepID=E6QUV8_9ZZZZ